MCGLGEFECFDVIRDGRLFVDGYNGVNSIVCLLGAQGSGKSAILQQLIGCGAKRAVVEASSADAWGTVVQGIGVLEIAGLDSAGNAEISRADELELQETRAGLFGVLGADIVVVNLSVVEVSRRDTPGFDLVERASKFGAVGIVHVVLHDDDGCTPVNKLEEIVRTRLAPTKVDSVTVLPHPTFRREKFGRQLLNLSDMILKAAGTENESKQPSRLMLAWGLAEVATVPVSSQHLPGWVRTDMTWRTCENKLDTQLAVIRTYGTQHQVGNQLAECLRSCLADFVADSSVTSCADGSVATIKAIEFGKMAQQKANSVYLNFIKKSCAELLAEATHALERKMQVLRTGPSFAILSRSLTTRTLEAFDHISEAGAMDNFEVERAAAKRKLSAELARTIVQLQLRIAEQVEGHCLQFFQRRFSSVLRNAHRVQDASLMYWCEVGASAKQLFEEAAAQARADLDYEEIGMQPSDVEERVRALARQCHTTAVAECRSHCGDENAFAMTLRELLRSRLPDQWPLTLNFPQQVREAATKTGLLIALFSFVPLGPLQTQATDGSPPPPVVEHFDAETRQRLVADLTRTAESEGRRALFDQMGHGFDFARTAASVVVAICNAPTLIR